MAKLTSLLILVCSLYTLPAQASSCTKPLLRAETADHKKEITLCRHDSTITYNYGWVNLPPVYTFDTGIDDVNYCYALYSTEGKVIISIADRVHENIYKITYGSDLNSLKANLMIVKGGRPISIEKLDPDTITGLIEHGVSSTGLHERTAVQ